MNNENTLLTEHKLNQLFTLKNKIIMAPMTRARSSEDLVPTKLMAEYYARRAQAGLIVTEGTVIQADALGYKNVPGIFSTEQIVNWRQTSDLVHHYNGLIFMQLWHVGRVSHPSFLNGKLPISASATTMTSRISRSNLTPGTSRAASLNEIKSLINYYAVAAENAIQAGFDGIELHGANGYLIDQFLHYQTNQREDEYGVTPVNMARFALEIVKACGEAIGYHRVGIRLSPGAYLHDIIGDPRDALVFEYLLNQLNHHPIAYVHVGNFNDSQTFSELNGMTMSAFIRTHYKGTLIACGSYSVEAAKIVIEKKEFDLIAFGRPFIANPNLIDIIRNNQTLRTYDTSMLNDLY